MTPFMLMMLLSPAAPPTAHAPKVTASKAQGPAPAAKPVEIDSAHLRVLGKQQKMLYTGHVTAKQGDVNLTCEKMTVFYAGDMQNYTRILCDGDVKVVEKDRWGKGDHADFDNLGGVLVFTGSPEAGDAHSHLKGSKVTFYVGSDQLDVEDPRVLSDSAAQAGDALSPPSPKKGKSGK